ncbi:acyltransferase [Curtobacterium sp. APC 4022]|uniref:acyltransferase family protein n=1 Tax=Curtobacterium sp. APC 4022 TaxID=3035201 RepID=UPI0025B599A4|nr:acyltransferase [Curtobacterium sp. APC 4022]MDN3477813.1 acyltransferase [Curtobacterium sp. APC 4022]
MDIPIATSRAPARIAALDGLRAVLAISISAYHMGAPGLQSAVLALPVFYALSGTLITSLLLAELHRHGRVRLGRFVLNRSLRIAPPVIVVVVAVALLWPWVGGYGESTSNLGLAAGLALTWTTNIGRAFLGVHQGVLDPLWSLSAEEQFYVFWPVLAALLLPVGRGRRLLLGILVAIVVLGPLCCAPFFTPSPDGGPASIYYAPPLSMSSLASGCLAALVLDRLRRSGRWSGTAGRLTTWCSLATLTALAALFPADWKSDPLALLLTIPLAGAVAAACIVGLGTSDSLPARLLAVRPLAWFGARASYSLYLSHLVVLALVEPRIDGVVGRAIAFAVAILVGCIGGVLVETPTDRFRRWVMRPRTSALPASAR